MARRRRDRWALGPAFSPPEAARGGPDCDVVSPHPLLAWVQFRDRILEVGTHVIAYTQRVVLVEWGFSQAAECAWVWVWRDAIRSHKQGWVLRGAPAVE